MSKLSHEHVLFGGSKEARDLNKQAVEKLFAEGNIENLIIAGRAPFEYGHYPKKGIPEKYNIVVIPPSIKKEDIEVWCPASETYVFQLKDGNIVFCPHYWLDIDQLNEMYERIRNFVYNNEGFEWSNMPPFLWPPRPEFFAFARAVKEEIITR